MRLATVLLSTCAVLTGCGTEQVPTAAQLPIARGDARVEWRGLAACADCEGIETVLVLERAGDERRYDLVETFLAEDGGGRFGEVGEWTLQAATLDLSSSTGARRRYRVLPGGGLGPDADGDVPADQGNGVLLPYQAATR
ncbi:MAG TPA: copper resistance protein NlpE N-terminal domain-containing protein [Luteimonas sp.]|nr:copper resistance protein NlpE N-terminal domain-containing protein [Luteimonas sp.]